MPADQEARSIGAGLLAPPACALPVPPAGDRGVWSAERLDQPTLSALRDRATADLSAPWPVPLASAFARYRRDGNRTEYESAVFARDQRLGRAAVMAAVTLEPCWIDEVVDGVSLLCEQSTWCWPAHDDVFQRGGVVPDVTRPYLDLGAGEVVAQLAWIDHLLGAQLDERAPGLRARIRYEADVRVLKPFVVRRDWHWLGLHGDAHNWTAWIHGNVLVAGLVLMAAGEERDRLVGLAAEGVERFVASIPSDGAIDEGAGYWWLGACRALEALAILAHASGGVLGGELPDSLRETIAFPHRMHLGGDWHLNFADGVARSRDVLPWDALHRAAQRAGDLEAAAYAAGHQVPDEPLAREDGGLGWLLRALTDADWGAVRSGERVVGAPLPRDVWLPSTQVFVARRTAGSSAGLTLAVKGGHNGENHNHNDVGTVVVALNGVPVVVDPGRPTYTAQTFGPDRYGIWTMQSSWHSVPEIRGSAQAAGAEFRARGVEVRADDDAAELALDLAGAYPRGDVVRWRRVARLDRGSGRVTVDEAWELEPEESEDGEDSGESTRVQVIVAGAVEVRADHVLITALDGAGAVRLEWEPVAVPVRVAFRELDDAYLADVWGERLSRLEFDVAGSGLAGRFGWRFQEAYIDGFPQPSRPKADSPTFTQKPCGERFTPAATDIGSTTNLSAQALTDPAPPPSPAQPAGRRPPTYPPRHP
jgi:hypothetical protein